MLDILKGGSVGGVLMFDLPPYRHMKAFEHYMYNYWSSSGECGEWSSLWVQEVLHIPRR
jgi:hypothetical protein